MTEEITVVTALKRKASVTIGSFIEFKKSVGVRLKKMAKTGKMIKREKIKPMISGHRKSREVKHFSPS
jgi:hypothetical protein